LVETVVVHEVGHQYFCGLLASNEFEEAWLDEGLDSYAELQCREAIAADKLAPTVRRGGLWTRERLGQSFVSSRFQIDQLSWEFQSPVQYYSASYGKTALTLRTLEGLLGAETFARAMRAYAERYRFRHPSGDDLFAVFSEVAGEDLGWYFEQAFRSDAMVDWGVLAVHHREGEPAGAPWSIDVDIGRHGDFAGPVSVQLEYEDGRRERRSWDGRARRVRWTLDTAQRLERVVVDPDAVWALETKRRDNYWAREESSRAACRALWWVPEALHWLGLFHLPWS
jgi:hypothetical protein